MQSRNLLHVFFLGRKEYVTKVKIVPDDHLKQDKENIVTNVLNGTDKARSEEAKISLKVTKSRVLNPSQPIPRLCRVLKFDCKNRPGHLCCATIELEETEDKSCRIQLSQKSTKENDNSHNKAAQVGTNNKRIPKFQRSKPSSKFDKSPVCKVIKCSNIRNKRHRCCILKNEKLNALKTNKSEIIRH